MPASPQSPHFLERASAFIDAQKALASPPPPQAMSFGAEGSAIMAANTAAARAAALQNRKALAGIVVAGALAGGPAGAVAAAIAHFATGGWAGSVALKTALAIAGSGITLAKTLFAPPDDSARTPPTPLDTEAPTPNPKPPFPGHERANTAAQPRSLHEASATQGQTMTIPPSPDARARQAAQSHLDEATLRGQAMPMPLSPDARARQAAQSYLDEATLHAQAMPMPLPPDTRARQAAQSHLDEATLHAQAMPMPLPPDARARQAAQSHFEAATLRGQAMPMPLPPDARARHAAQSLHDEATLHGRDMPMPLPPGAGHSLPADPRKTNSSSDSYAGQADHSLDIHPDAPDFPAYLDDAPSALARKRALKAPASSLPGIAPPPRGMDI